MHEGVLGHRHFAVVVVAVLPMLLLMIFLLLPISLLSASVFSILWCFPLGCFREILPLWFSVVFIAGVSDQTTVDLLLLLRLWFISLLSLLSGICLRVIRSGMDGTKTIRVNK